MGNPIPKIVTRQGAAGVAPRGSIPVALFGLTGEGGGGEAGPQGPQGEPGPQGIQGPVGPQGPRGNTGATGAAGPTGPAGKDGLIGPTGPKGDKGDKGDAGAQGIQGLRGFTGETGIQGATGPAGERGPQGAAGATGPTGPAGLTGPKGDAGPIGPEGLVGPEGPIGLRGLKGDKGDKGDPGTQGIQGAQGATGLTGPKGDKGDPGIQGVQGPRGLVGETGIQGATGPAGERGPTGATGSDGAQGPQGLTGPKGDKGDAGPQGIQGVQGPTGPKGEKGDGTLNPADYGVPTNGSANAGPAMNAMISAIPEGSIIQAMPGQVFNVGSQINITKRITIRGGTWMHQPSATTFMTTVSGVVFDGLTIIGPALTEATQPTSSRFIYANGSEASQIDRLQIRNCVMLNCHHTALRLNWCKNFIVDSNSIENVQYAAIMIMSPKVGTVSNNTCRNMVQGGSLINSYGIAVSDSDNVGPSRAQDVLITGNLVEGVLKWEGIDTHGGKGILVIANTLRACRYPIAMVVGNPDRTLSPQACVVANNYIERAGAPDETGAINYVGLNSGQLCDGLIGVNTIRGYTREVRVAFYDPDKMTVMPQDSDASNKHSPDVAPFRMYMQDIQLTIPANSLTATNRALSFPAGKFRDVPRIVATPSQNSAPGFAPHTYSQTATGFNLGGAVQTTSTSSRTVTVTVLAIQMDSATGTVPGI